MIARRGAGPRLYGIVATRAPVVAVLRRGPTDWWHVGAWHVAEPRYEPGAWFKGALYPQKCDLSPDGRWLAYSALKAGSSWAAGTIYEAISRVPWLTALAAWEAGTTYTTGIHFDEEHGVSEIGVPDVGDAAACLRRYGIKVTRRSQFAVERRRGWTESPETRPRDDGGAFDEWRDVVMEKQQPSSAAGPKLVVEGSFAGFRSMPHWYDPAVYSLQWEDDLEVLEAVQWADWGPNGALLVAATEGTLEVRSLHGRTMVTIWAHDLSTLKPDPRPAPKWASEW